MSWKIYLLIASTILFCSTYPRSCFSYSSLEKQIAEYVHPDSSSVKRRQIYASIRNSGKYKQKLLLDRHIVLISEEPDRNKEIIQEIETLLKMAIFSNAKKYLQTQNMQIGIVFTDLMDIKHHGNVPAGLNSLLSKTNPSKVSHGFIMINTRLPTKYKITKKQVTGGHEYKLEQNLPLTVLLNEIYEVIEAHKFKEQSLFSTTTEYQSASSAIDHTLRKVILHNYQTDFANASPKQRNQILSTSSQIISSEWLVQTINQTKNIYLVGYKNRDKLTNQQAAHAAAKALTERLHNYYPWATSVVFLPAWNQANQEYIINIKK